MERIHKYTRKVSQNVVNCYCSHVLKDKQMMEDLGVDDLSTIEYDIENYEFSLMIDHYGRFEDMLRKYKVETWEQLEQALVDYREKHSRKKKNG